MIGYILIGIGAWLLIDDWKAAKAKKLNKGGEDGKLPENGNDRGGSNRAGKSGKLRQKSDRDGGIGIPVKKAKKGVEDELSKKPVHKVKPDKNSDSSGDNRGRQPDAATVGDQGKGLSPAKAGSNKKSKEGGQDAGSEINHENDARDNGNHVRAEPISGHEPDGTKTD